MKTPSLTMDVIEPSLKIARHADAGGQQFSGTFDIMPFTCRPTSEWVRDNENPKE